MTITSCIAQQLCATRDSLYNNCAISYSAAQMKTIIFNEILSAVEAATEIDRALILSHSKQNDIVEARCLLFHYLQRADFYPSQIARMTNQSRQCVGCLLMSFDARCKYSANMMKRYVQKLDKELSEYLLPTE